MSGKLHFCCYKSNAFSQNRVTYIYFRCDMSGLVQNRAQNSLELHCTWDLGQDCLEVHTVFGLTQFRNVMEAEIPKS